MAALDDLANMALLRVGAEPITLITDDNNRAKACNAAWPYVRKQVLRSHSWNCATKRVALTADGTDPIYDFDTRYAVPADSLHIMEVDTTYDWRVEEGFIVTDGTGALNIRYIVDVTDPDNFDASLLYVMALRLAVEICERITGNRVKRELLLQEYQSALNDAMVDDGEEQSPAEFEEDLWVTSRY